MKKLIVLLFLIVTIVCVSACNPTRPSKQSEDKSTPNSESVIDNEVGGEFMW
jgi:ABC-type Fe3+-citrate transport system substrate-binding protein